MKRTLLRSSLVPCENAAQHARNDPCSRFSRHQEEGSQGEGFVRYPLAFRPRPVHPHPPPFSLCASFLGREKGDKALACAVEDTRHASDKRTEL
jgi:hypothetical protein